MFKRVKWPVALLLTLSVVALMLGVFLAPASAGTCYGTLFEYFESPALQVHTGAKVVCAGFPNQYDSGDNGGYSETPWYTTTTVVCPCSGSSGGGSGGGDPNDTDCDAEEDC